MELLRRIFPRWGDRVVEPLLGRWCHRGSHRRCDPFLKVDQANADSCMTCTPRAAPRATPEVTRDPVTSLLDAFGN
jgi:hypothetical protein